MFLPPLIVGRNFIGFCSGAMAVELGHSSLHRLQERERREGGDALWSFLCSAFICVEGVSLGVAN